MRNKYFDLVLFRNWPISVFPYVKSSKGPDSWGRQRPLGRPAVIMLKYANQKFFLHLSFWTLKPKRLWSTIGRYLIFFIPFLIISVICLERVLYFKKGVLVAKELNYSKESEILKAFWNCFLNAFTFYNLHSKHLPFWNRFLRAFTFYNLHSKHSQIKSWSDHQPWDQLTFASKFSKHLPFWNCFLSVLMFYNLHSKHLPVWNQFLRAFTFYNLHSKHS